MPDEVSLESIPPLPQPDALTQFFWDGTQAHKLLILRCQDCGHYIHYPRPICNKCLSTNLAPGEVSGKGVLDTYTIPMQPIDPYFIEHMPYVYAVVELAEEKNLKIITNIIDCTEEQLEIGMEVEVVFREVTPEVTLPLFRPTDPARITRS